MKLTDTEKYIIVGMHFHNISIKEIKKALGKSPGAIVVDRYLANFLESLQVVEEEVPEVKATRKVDRSYSETKKPLKEYGVTYDHQAVLAKMSQAGIHGEDALRLIEKALSKFTNQSVEASQVYSEAMKNIGARELMVRSGTHGAKGVAIMTEGAASKGNREGILAKTRSHQQDGVFNVSSPKRKK